MHANAQALISLPHSPRAKNRDALPVAVVGAGQGEAKIANRLVHHGRARPTHMGLVSIEVEIAAAGHPRPNLVKIPVGDVPQIHVGDGAAASTGEGDGGRFGGGAGDSDVVVGVGRAPVNSVPRTKGHVSEVEGRIGGRRREERRQAVEAGGSVPQKGAGSLVGVSACIAAAGADVGADIANVDGGAGRAAKHPEGLVGVVPTGEDVDVQLRLPLLHRNKKRKRRNDQNR